MAFEVKPEYDGCTPGQYAVVGPNGLDSCYSTEAEATGQVADLNASAGFTTPTQNAMGEYPWEGPIAFMDVDTGDGRILDQKTLGAASLPRPLAVQTSIAPGHDGAEVGGRIDSIDFRDDGVVWATGVFEDTDFGKLAAYRVGNQILKGISVDVRDGEAVPEGSYDSEDPFAPPPVVRIVGGNIMGATVVMHPAFVDAQIRLVGDVNVPLVASAAFAQAIAALVASGAPIVRPAAWFTNPGLDGPTPLQIDGDHIWGHIGTWGVCHVGIAGVCQPPPRGVEYSWFMQGQVETDAGNVRTGTYSFHANHASVSRGMTAGSAADHYANSALGGADVVVGEDSHGVWINGAVRPSLTPEQRVELLASKPSGDWREMRGRTALMGIHAVNQPGFPIPQTLVASAADGTIVRLQGATGDLYVDHFAVVASGACTCGEHGNEDEMPEEIAPVMSVEDRLARLESLISEALGAQIIETLSARIRTPIA